MATTTLYRAAKDDTLPADCASFATSLETARAYIDNPGFGGATLYSAAVEFADGATLDLSTESDPVQWLCDELGEAHPGAITVDVWIPMDGRLQDKLRAAGYDWVLVPETYPAATVTWLWIGPWEREPELEEIE